MTARFTSGPALLALLLVAALARTAAAEPRFAARWAMPCSACHLNPTGGGPRNSFGRDIFEKQQLTFFPGSGLQRKLSFDPRVADMLSFGANLRAAFIAQPTRSDSDTPPSAVSLFQKLPTRYGFFLMQADLYMAAELGKYVLLYLDLGAQGSFETFGLVRNLPGGLYLKAGYFLPPYGTKLPNHTAAHRQPIGFDPRGKDAGLEIGLQNRWVDLQVAIQNGELGTPLDKVEGPALSARGAFLHAFGPLRLTLGGSVRCAWHQQDAMVRGVAVKPYSTECQEGLFLWLALGRLSWIQEIDFALLDDASKLDPNGVPERSGRFVAYQELGVLAARGVDIGLTYEYMDRDLYASGDVLHRIGLQASLFPMPYVETQVLVRHYLARPDREENGQWEILAFLHLFF